MSGTHLYHQGLCAGLEAICANRVCDVARGRVRGSLPSAENLVRAASDAPSEVARAVSATERAICEELRLGKVSVASSGLGNQEENVDPEYQCPICLVGFMTSVYTCLWNRLPLSGCDSSASRAP